MTAPLGGGCDTNFRLTVIGPLKGGIAPCGGGIGSYLRSRTDLFQPPEGGVAPLGDGCDTEFHLTVL